MTLATWAAVALAGAAGALARYVIDRAIGRRVAAELPFGTLLVNVTGSLLLGWLTGLTLYHGFGGWREVVLGAGFCGAYTTFSTLTYETLVLGEEGQSGAAVMSVAANTFLGLGAAAVGLALGAVA